MMIKSEICGDNVKEKLIGKFCLSKTYSIQILAYICLYKRLECYKIYVFKKNDFILILSKLICTL